MAVSTTTTSLTASPTATAPILAFTTPFPQPASCSPSSLLTTSVNHAVVSGTTISQTFLRPDTSDARYTACLAPAGGQFTFSPAVCPQGWPAWWLGMTSTVIGAATTKAYVSTAYCCAPGYTMLDRGGLDNPSPSCEQAFLRTTSSSGANLVSTTTLSVARLPAWHISWQPTDIPTLSPQPPAIEGHERIMRWEPGSDPQRERKDGWGGGLSPSLFYFLVAGIPIIVVAALIACVTACCAPLRRRRGDKEEVGKPERLGESHTTS